MASPKNQLHILAHRSPTIKGNKKPDTLIRFFICMTRLPLPQRLT
jgi:hypothetical protein